MIKEWNCIPREKIPWNPTVDEAKCTGCTFCASMCPDAAIEVDE